MLPFKRAYLVSFNHSNCRQSIPLSRGVSYMKMCVAAFAAVFMGLITAPAFAQTQSVEKKDFGKTADGRHVDLYTLTNSHGSEAKIITYGGTLVSLKVPDRKGVHSDVLLGFDSMEGYEKQTAYIGALIGRYGNRIAKGHFTLGGKDYTLATNNGPNH